MRKELLKLLEDIEKGSGVKTEVHDYIYGPDSSEEEYLEYYRNVDRNKLLKYDYEKFFEENENYCMVRAFLIFPNYGFIVKELSDYIEKNKMRNSISESSIKAELKRMESDGLVMIGTQTIQEYTYVVDGSFNHVLGKGWTTKTESIILTTLGRSKWRYFWHKTTENPFAVIAILISLASLVISIAKI